MLRWAMLLLSVVVAGCGQSAPTPGAATAHLSPPEAATAHPSASTVSGAPTPQPSAADAIMFAGAPIHLPAGWRAVSPFFGSSFDQLIAFLGPGLDPAPCDSYTKGSACYLWGLIHLPADGLFVALVRHGGPPGVTIDMTTGEAVTVAGRMGRIAVVEVDSGCRAMGGDEQLRVIAPSQGIWNWDQLDACLRGPNDAAGEATVRGLITNLEPTTLEQPMNWDVTIPNDNGYVAAPGRLRLRDATFTFPASWQAVREPVWTPSRTAIATIGPGPIPLCANWSTCGLWPDMRLPADGVIVSAWNRGDGDWTLAVAPGAPMTIGGQPAKLATGPVDAACAAIGGDELMTASLADTPGAQVGVEFDACLRGPDLATNEALVRGFLAAAVRTPRWTPDESPRASP